jgi:two-component system, NarL family, sensor kinase
VGVYLNTTMTRAGLAVAAGSTTLIASGLGYTTAEALGLGGLAVGLGLAIRLAARPRRQLVARPDPVIDPLARPHDREPSRVHGRLEALARHLVEQQETERQAVVGVLQRDVAELLAGLAASLDGMRRGAPRETADTLAEAHELVGDLMQRTRELIEELRPPALDELGLAAALDDRLRRYEIETGIDVTLRHSLAGVQPGPMIAITLYRLVVESLRLVSYHGARGILVRLHAADGRIHLEIRDDGGGSDGGRGRPLANGSTLQSSAILLLQETIELLGGSTRQRSSAAGNLIAVELPLDGGATGIERRRVAHAVLRA